MPISKNQTTVQSVIDLIINKCTGEPIKKTVDTVKLGDPSQVVKGITTTFLATRRVIEKSAELGHNFIITHEPTFYNHLDETDWLINDTVFQSKKKLAEKHDMVIWRCHDYIHRMQPDGILTGMIEQFGWEKNRLPEHHTLFKLQRQKVSDLINFFKENLGVRSIKSIGDPNMMIEKVGFAMGAPGGKAQISIASKYNPDVLVCGEIHEWEIAEYIRDAIQSGLKIALILIGHANSEEAGMKWMAEWLRPMLPGIRIKHIPAKDPFTN